MSSRWLTNEDEAMPPPVNLNHLVRNATYDPANHKIILQKHDNVTTVDVDITTLGTHNTSLTQHSKIRLKMPGIKHRHKLILILLQSYVVLDALRTVTNSMC